MILMSPRAPNHVAPVACKMLQSFGTSIRRPRPGIQWQPSRRRTHTSSRDRSHLPLDGITVVSLEQAIAAPFCTRQLADLGARVIKVERPVTGDFARAYDTRVNGLASHFVWVNRSKESLALDLKQERDLNNLKRLLKKTDVLVQNLTPGATDRLGISYAKLKDEHPSLIFCDISGYGDSGPYRDKKAYDLLVQSEAGLLSVTGTETEHAKAGISIADIAAGMYAYTGVLAALMKRSKTGKGSKLDISMLEAMTEWMNFPMYYAYNGQSAPRRSGAAHAAIYPYGPFETGGNGTVLLGIQNEREWAKLCTEVLELRDLALNPLFTNNSLRVQNRDKLRKIICDSFSNLSVAEVIYKLDKAQIANAQLKDMQGLWNHEQLRARGRWTEVETSKGWIPALLPPGIASLEDTRMDKVPEVGEHNAEILAELGLEL
ncbi:L-carnitine dehydratase/bile acid-inducible protein F [Xylaria bambusicola]|uniref:L-carnitine dehydratase/bile acid-inducible protein F n=1 Tax=Xylaria bambusicola TaxID=326684 RepID=UPI002007F312|nr:L-carnitine dehydratase/bile acid-inducible protein F [Xylaria bambusicola]KAI0526649.1 L-carnitine dehydratase/bile acid-inducible protein F [Xylaria bambusicola]